jgi:hypothetical protein
MNTTRQNDAMDITVPEDVYEKKLSEVFGESMHEAQRNAVDASIKSTLSMMRAQAELSYENNGQSYAQVCSDDSLQPLFETIVTRAELFGVQYDAPSDMFNVTCNDSKDSYAIASPLVEEDFGTAFCVDSTGFASEVSTEALSTGTDMTCE